MRKGVLCLCPKMIIIGYILFFTGTASASAIDAEFKSNELSLTDVPLLKKYIKETTFIKYYYPEYDGYYNPADSIEYTYNLNQLRLTGQFGQSYMMRACGAKIVNQYFKNNGISIILPDDNCYVYARALDNSSWLQTKSVIEYREKINIGSVISNPYSCAYNGSCSKLDDHKINPNDLADTYSKLLLYSKQCTSINCKIDIGLIAYNARLFQSQVDDLQAVAPDIPAKYPTNAILNAVNKNISNEYQNKWDLLSALIGQGDVYTCKLSSLQGNTTFDDGHLDGCLRSTRYLQLALNNVDINQRRYAEGVSDAIKTVNKYQPNQQQVESIIKLLQNKANHYQARGDLQGF